jgi:hypothetical protein
MENPMAQADSHNSTRRAFLSNAAGVAAGATAALVATKAVALPAEDGALLKLEENYDEIFKLSEIWHAESYRMYQEALLREVQAGTYLTPEERWALVSKTPESREHDRLCSLRDFHLVKMEALVKQMWATPALPRRDVGPKSWLRSACCLTPGERWTRKPTMGSVRPDSS